MESFKINDPVEVIDEETGRWTAAIIASAVDNNSTIRIRYPGWTGEWSSGQVKIANVRAPTTKEPCQRLRPKRLLPWKKSAINLVKLEKGENVFVRTENERSFPAVVHVVDPFLNEVLVTLQDGSRKSVAAENLSSVASCPAPTQKKRKTMKPRVPSSSQVLRAKIVSPPIEASPPEFDLVYTILESGLVIRCGEAYQGLSSVLLITKILLRNPGIIVRGRKLANDPLLVSNEFLEITADQLIRKIAFKCDASRLIKLEAIRRMQLSTSLMNLFHLRFQRKNEVGLLLRTQVRSLMTSKGRSGSFTLPFNAAFDGELLHLETAFGLKTDLALQELYLLDEIAGTGWDYKPIDAKEESLGFFYFVKSMTISVDLNSLLLKFTATYTKSQFIWTANYRSDCSNQIRG